MDEAKLKEIENLISELYINGRRETLPLLFGLLLYDNIRIIDITGKEWIYLSSKSSEFIFDIFINNIKTHNRIYKIEQALN